MMTVPRRRWFRFTLRTLFLVMTAACCWLGYQLNWIRERHAVLASYSEPDLLGPIEPDAARKRAPLSLALLGESGYGCIVFEWAVPRLNRTRAEYPRLERLFPEAYIASGKQIPWNAEPPPATLADRP